MFSCGIAALDRYLKQQSGQDARKYVAAPFLLIQRDSGAIAGYYTLSATGVRLAELPADLARNLPKYPFVPATLLGRLAIDRRHQGKGLGEFLLVDALHRSFKMSRQIASLAVVVDAQDEKARGFYLRYHFIRFPETPNRLFLLMKTISGLFG
ncbi:MAG: GNAT family N-acetyltransferase [Chloroflexi bacterium]|nr:GNAT family N-acetyltransferase [Chloroflexota bacterium]